MTAVNDSRSRSLNKVAPGECIPGSLSLIRWVPLILTLGDNSSADHDERKYSSVETRSLWKTNSVKRRVVLLTRLFQLTKDLVGATLWLRVKYPMKISWAAYALDRVVLSVHAWEVSSSQTAKMQCALRATISGTSIVSLLQSILWLLFRTDTWISRPPPSEEGPDYHFSRTNL